MDAFSNRFPNVLATFPKRVATPLNGDTSLMLRLRMALGGEERMLLKRFPNVFRTFSKRFPIVFQTFRKRV